MMAGAAVTVITACLNAVRTVETALRSVISQDWPGLEYIVVDGGSTDGTLEVLENYRPFLARLISEPDKGVYDAFNKGLALASGDIVGILNADDCYAPWTFGTVAEASRLHPECGVFYGKLAVIDEARRRWTVYPLGDHERLPNHMIAHPAAFVRKNLYEKHGFFDESYKIAGDWDLFLRFWLAGEGFCPIDRVLTAFRNAGLSSRPTRRLVRENRAVYRKYRGKIAGLSGAAYFGKTVREELKYWGRKGMELSGLYGLYSRYRDARLLNAEGWGAYDGPESLWNAVKALEEIEAIRD
ncbi:MAG: glycosyltransferase [Synergistaceae bacterium]|jgi:glycosyltransferase involved in cell wall biosynthesis|nr:glycosyltransferase [Synergistaceae bacterium]